MTWKAYAAVSGATVLAGWLASSPPANAPAPMTSPARPPRARQGGATADIQEQAERLQTRLHGDRNYIAPQRNPFRFEGGGDSDPGLLDRGMPSDGEPEPQPEPPAVEPPPSMTLSGIAEDLANGQISRTAVISLPAGVELVREGDEILGYRVAHIESEAVELVRISDGSVRRMTLNR